MTVLFWIPVSISFFFFLFEKFLFYQYRGFESSQGLTGCEIARHILDDYGFSGVVVEPLARCCRWQKTKLDQFFLDEFICTGKSLYSLAWAAREAVRRVKGSGFILFLDLRRFGGEGLRYVILAAWIVCVAGFLSANLRVLIPVSLVVFDIVIFGAFLAWPRESEISRQGYDLSRRSAYFEVDEQARLKVLMNSMRFHDFSFIWRVPVDLFREFRKSEKKSRGL